MMADPIGPGDWVECVDASPNDWDGATLLSSGAIYRVREIVPGLLFDRSASKGILLEGIHHIGSNGLEASFRANRFRPIYRRRDAEALTAKLLVGARAKGPLVPAQVDREGSRDAIK